MDLTQLCPFLSPKAQDNITGSQFPCFIYTYNYIRALIRKLTQEKQHEHYNAWK